MNYIYYNKNKNTIYHVNGSCSHNKDSDLLFKYENVMDSKFNIDTILDHFKTFLNCEHIVHCWRVKWCMKYASIVEE